MKTLEQEISAMNSALANTHSEAIDLMRKIVITDSTIHRAEIFEGDPNGITAAWEHVRSVRDATVGV